MVALPLVLAAALLGAGTHGGLPETTCAAIVDKQVGFCVQAFPEPFQTGYKARFFVGGEREGFHIASSGSAGHVLWNATSCTAVRPGPSREALAVEADAADADGDLVPEPSVAPALFPEAPAC